MDDVRKLYDAILPWFAERAAGYLGLGPDESGELWVSPAELASELTALGLRVASPDSLDAAWAEAEAALPEGWRIHLLEATASGEWRAVAGVRIDDGTDPFIAIAGGDGRVGATPAAALRALAARLRDA